jgi:2-methylcitrate dehydratase PrpD
LTLKNGKVLRREQPEPKGEPANPLTEQELSDKFTGLVKMVKGAQNLGPGLSEKLMNLENQASVSEIITSLKAQDETPVLAEA